MSRCTCVVGLGRTNSYSVVSGIAHRKGCKMRAFADAKLSLEEPKITIEMIDEALRKILGNAIRAYMDRDDGPISNRTLAMSRAAEKSWIDDRPDDWSAVVLRQGLRNLSKHGVIVPKEGA